MRFASTTGSSSRSSSSCVNVVAHRSILLPGVTTYAYVGYASVGCRVECPRLPVIMTPVTVTPHHRTAGGRPRSSRTRGGWAYPGEHDPVVVDLAVDRRPGHPEGACGPGLVPAGVGQGPHDRVALHGLDQAELATAHRAHARAAGRPARWCRYAGAAPPRGAPRAPARALPGQVPRVSVPIASGEQLEVAARAELAEEERHQRGQVAQVEAQRRHLDGPREQPQQRAPCRGPSFTRLTVTATQGGLPSVDRRALPEGGGELAEPDPVEGVDVPDDDAGVRSGQGVPERPEPVRGGAGVRGVEDLEVPDGLARAAGPPGAGPACRPPARRRPPATRPSARPPRPVGRRAATPGPSRPGPAGASGASRRGSCARAGGSGPA